MESEEDVQIIPLLKICYNVFLENWKWFLLSVVLCVVLGWFYQQRSSRVYQRQAVMLIEDADGSSFSGSPGRRSRNSMNTLLELNGISVGDNLKNEMFVLTSFRLMKRVVDSLHLDVDYTTQENLHAVALYRNRPFEVRFMTGRPKKPVRFNVKILDDGVLALSNFIVGPEKVGGEYKVQAGQAVRTPAGNLQLEKKKDFPGFPRNKEVTVTRIPVELAARSYQNSVTASEFDKESSLIVLTCNDVDKDRGDDILYEIFNAYKRDVVDNKNRVAQSTARFIDGRIEIIGQELGKVENQWADFKQDNRILDFKQSAQVYMTETSAARQAALQLETELTVARYLSEYIKDHSNDRELIPVLAIANTSFAPQIEEYNRMMNERNSLAENSNELTSVIRERDRQLSSMRASILASIGSYVKSVELKLREAHVNEANLMGKVSGIPEQEKRGLGIMRQQNLKEALYTYLLNKREEVALQLAINEANVRMVEEPMGGINPVSPRSNLILFVSFVIGLLIPSGILWLRMLFDVTVKGRRDIENYTTIPLVGEVPRWEEGKNGNGLIASCPPDAPVVEAFRVLRYGLNFMRHNARVMVLTSTTPSQGKSFVSRNLSVILGMANKRVLLVDADIRKRTLSKSFGRTGGLTAFLADTEGVMSLNDIVIRDGMAEGVDFLPAGMLPPNPSELLMSQRLDELVELAKKQYDYVLFDTTPVLSVADAGIVDRLADLTLYVVRVGVENRNFLPELEKMYLNKKLRNLCIILNDCDVKSHTYGYGYGYGYGNAIEHDKKRNRRNIFRKKR